MTEGMRLRRLCAIAAVFTFLGALAAAPASASLYTKREAEVNILKAVRVLNRWRIGVVNPATMTLRSNTSVACRGLGRVATGRRYARFVCTIKYRTRRVRLMYVAPPGPRRAFWLQRLR
jgi:hypothetical protein